MRDANTDGATKEVLRYREALFVGYNYIKHKPDYYRLLREVTTKGNWEDWILYILKGIEQTSHDTIKQIEQLNRLFDAPLKKLKNIPLKCIQKN